MTRNEFPRLRPPHRPPPVASPHPDATHRNYRRPGLPPSEIERRLTRVLVWTFVVLLVLTIGVQLGIRQGRTLERQDAARAAALRGDR